MASRIYSLRATEQERTRWEKAAQLSNLTYNAWARRALNSQAELDEALSRLEKDKEPSL